MRSASERANGQASSPVLKSVFKDKGIAKQCPEYNLLINQLKEKLRMLTEKQAMINKKQKDLEFIIEDFPLLETCKKNIAPYENFWKAYAELDKCN